MADNRFNFRNYCFCYTQKSFLNSPDHEHFQYNSKEVTPKIFRFLPVKTISEDVKLWKDRRGRAILSLYEDVPTFDIYDREYDGDLYLYLVPHDGFLTCFTVNSGYKLGSVTVYEDVHFGDEATRQAMNELGFFDDAPKKGAYKLPKY